MHEMSEILSRANVARYIWGERCSGWPLLDSHELRVVQETIPPGAGEVRHLHRHALQFFFVLSGRAMMEIEGEVAALGVHQGCAVVPGVPHRIWNDGTEDLEFLVVSAPTTVGDRVLSEARDRAEAGGA